MSHTKKNLPSLSHGQCPQWRSDYLLVQRFLSGDTSAWNILYRQSYPVVLRFLRHQNMVRFLISCDVSDILSEAFLRCQAYAHRFQGRSRFSTYVCGFARYVALEMVRKQISTDRKTVNLLVLCCPDHLTATPEDILICRERDQCLWTAYHALSPRHQVLIGYLVLERNTYHEARRATGLRFKAEMETELPQALYFLKQFFLKLYYSPTYSTQRRSS